jgi:hypothetical protein
MGSGKQGDRRRERLEAALRANLKKRKEQASARERVGGSRDAVPAKTARGGEAD